MTHVIVRDAEHYMEGPQQAKPADGILKTGTKVKMLSEAEAYSRVETESGLKTFVEISALKKM